MKNNKSKQDDKSSGKSDADIIADLPKRKAYTVHFTLSPKHPLSDFTGADEDIQRAVLEAEFLAAVLSHELVTDNLAEVIRGFLFGSCIFIAKSLEQHKADDQMIRDIYPYARLIESEMFSRIFENFVLEVIQDAPELYRMLMEVKADA